MEFATDVPQPASLIEPTSTLNKVKLEPSLSLNFGEEQKRDVSSRGLASKVIDISDSPEAEAPRPSVVKEEIPPQILEYLSVSNLTIDLCDSPEKMASQSAHPAAEGTGEEDSDNDELTKELEPYMEQELGMNSSAA